MTIRSPAAKDAETVNASSGRVDTAPEITGPSRAIRIRLLALYRRSPGIIAAGALAVAFGTAYLLAPPMGRDFSAQLAHAELAESHWPELLDLRWYGGFNPLGYSVLSPPVMALLGVPLTTALAYVATVVLFAALLKNAGVPRPVVGAITGAVCLTGNLVVTRTTFALGLALGLGALLALISGRLRVSSGLSVLAPLASPVAGVFLGVAGGALFLSGRRRAGVVLAVSALVPTIAIALAFGNGGYQTFAAKQALVSLIVCLAVTGLCWRRPVVRWGGLLSAVLVVAAYLLPTPVGTTATRLPELFAAPIIVAAATVPLVAIIAATASAVLLLPPVSITEVRERGDPALSGEFYAPLLHQLTARKAAGPIEVVPTRATRRSCLRGASGCNRKRVVATSRHRAPRHLLQRNPQRGHVPKMARRQRHLLCGDLARAVRLVGARRSEPGTPWAAVLESTVVEPKLDPLCRDKPDAGHRSPRASCRS